MPINFVGKLLRPPGTLEAVGTPCANALLNKEVGKMNMKSFWSGALLASVVWFFILVDRLAWWDELGDKMDTAWNFIWNDASRVIGVIVLALIGAAYLLGIDTEVKHDRSS